MIANIIVIILVVLGTLFISVAGIGIIRMPDAYTRMSVVTKAVTLGIGTIMVAVIVHFNDTLVMLKIFVLIAFLLFSLSIAAHVIGISAYRDGNKLWEGTFRDEFKGDRDKAERERENEAMNRAEDQQSKEEDN